MRNKIIFIAEAGVNHNGSVVKAKKLIDGAAYAGADYIKFQTFNADTLTTPSTPKANYQIKNLDNKKLVSQYNMLKKLQLSLEDHYELKKYANKKKIKFLSSAFDLSSLEFLSKLKIDFIKIPSGEVDNIPYLESVGKLNQETILSTGMSSIFEIEKAINLLIKSGLNKKKLTVLQCNTEYPSPLADSNIRAMLSIKDKFNVKIGYSDDTKGSESIFAAVALGAKIIEKHFTLNKNDKGPDHLASASVNELKEIIKTSKNILIALGSPIKKVTKSEKKNISVVRRKIFASKEIKKGEVFTKKNLIPLRSKVGISVKYWKKYIGKKAKKNYRYLNSL